MLVSKKFRIYNIQTTQNLPPQKCTSIKYSTVCIPFKPFHIQIQNTNNIIIKLIVQQIYKFESNKCTPQIKYTIGLLQIFPIFKAKHMKKPVIHDIPKF